MAGLYLHVPFCEKRCLYCDFFFVVSGERGPYLRALGREIDTWADRLGAVSLSTVYFGGGTPSELTGGEVAAILGQIGDRFSLEPDAEITLEANPGSTDADRFAAYRAAGVNRLSLGVQSFDDDQLRRLGRVHTADEARRAVQLARSAGFDNLSLDLMFGLPGGSVEQLERSIGSALELEPEHLSAYNLTVESGTMLDRHVRRGQVVVPDDERCAAEFTHLIDRLGAASYRQYEVSNFARPGFESQHNSGYWRHEPCIAVGPAAHGLLPSGWAERVFGPQPVGTERVRYWNSRHLTGYINSVERDGFAVADGETLGGRALAQERIFLGLRQPEIGLDLTALLALGVDLSIERSAELAELAADGLIAFDARTVRLTRRGVMLGDAVAERLMLDPDSATVAPLAVAPLVAPLHPDVPHRF